MFNPFLIIISVVSFETTNVSGMSIKKELVNSVKYFSALSNGILKVSIFSILKFPIKFENNMKSKFLKDRSKIFDSNCSKYEVEN